MTSPIPELVAAHGAAVIKQPVGITLPEPDTNPRAVIGGNNPPAELTPRELVTKPLNDLWDEACLWIDGKPIESEEQAQDLANLLRMMQEARAKAEAQRKIEVAPLDEAKDEIQAYYNPLISDNKKSPGKIVQAITAVQADQVAWLEKKAATLREAQRQARAKADAEAEAARALLQAANPDNLAEKAAAEAALADAARMERQAAKLEKTTAKVSGGIGRAVSLRTVTTAIVIDPPAFAAWAWQHRPDEYAEAMRILAQRAVDTGLRDLPGIMIDEQKVAR